MPGGAPPPGERFEVAFADDDGEQRLPWTAAWSVPFESCRPVREFPSYKGQRHLSGRWWTATTGSLVGYESWLERDTLIVLDFDPDVVGIASQPFWLFWTTAEGKPRSHAPDYFARLADGSARVIDCRPADRIKPRDAAAFEAARDACAVMGWSYEVVDSPGEVLLGNLRWLAGYRHPRHGLAEPARHLRAVFAKPGPLMSRVSVVGAPIALLPVLYHLLWRGDLHTDLSVPLHENSIVAAAPKLVTA
uniref:TnsA-like heteromeric transposase endonuclease subunit n=1 Tax=Amycolatopsis sp. CA-096443 TaxID=3239919 RepID=UPI003F494E4B